MNELEELRGIARRAAAIAAEIVMPLYCEGVTVELKADRTPVTVADRRAEEAMRSFLARECPGHGVLGEELGESPGDGRHRWILDPIDGTKSFVHHVPLFGTLVALERDGVPCVGVISCPAVGETVDGVTGGDAYLNGKRTSVSVVTSVAASAISLTSFSRLAHMHPHGFARLAALGSTSLLRAWGDCYGYLLVASGRIEGMLDPEMSVWDAAALLPVVTAAGGRLTTWRGEPRVGDSVVATNGRIHEELLALVQD
jgi:histidinol phosphatase-like enzyme (inositol monophosphatase family)